MSFVQQMPFATDLWSFLQKVLRSILILRGNLRHYSFLQKFLREYLRVKSDSTNPLVKS